MAQPPRAWPLACGRAVLWPCAQGSTAAVSSASLGPMPVAPDEGVVASDAALQGWQLRGGQQVDHQLAHAHGGGRLGPGSSHGRLCVGGRAHELACRPALAGSIVAVAAVRGHRCGFGEGGALARRLGVAGGLGAIGHSFCSSSSTAHPLLAYSINSAACVATIGFRVAIAATAAAGVHAGRPAQAGAPAHAACAGQAGAPAHADRAPAQAGAGGCLLCICQRAHLDHLQLLGRGHQAEQHGRRLAAARHQRHLAPLPAEVAPHLQLLQQLQQRRCTGRPALDGGSGPVHHRHGGLTWGGLGQGGGRRLLHRRSLLLLRCLLRCL